MYLASTFYLHSATLVPSASMVEGALSALTHLMPRLGLVWVHSCTLSTMFAAGMLPAWSH